MRRAGRVRCRTKGKTPRSLLAFHREDYGRAAQLVRSLRTDAAGHPKNAGQQEWADALAVAMAAVFEADSLQFGIPFSPSYFVAGTR